jgi:pimeloyl-ACP methyl ester carboxylesterase
VVSDYDPVAQRFAAWNIALTVFGYRGYGDGSGSPTLRAAFEDAHRILKELLTRLWDQPDVPVILMGRSLGSGPAIELAATECAVHALIIESGYADARRLVARRGLPAPELDDAERRTFSNVDKIFHVRVPLLILHGRADRLILVDEASMLHRAAGSTDRRLVVLDHVGHNDLSRHADYWPGIRAFVKHVISAG